MSVVSGVEWLKRLGYCGGVKSECSGGDDQGVLPDIAFDAKEYKVICLRETPVDTLDGSTPQAIADYWRSVIEPADRFNSEVECMVLFFINTRRRIKGHVWLASGTQDTILCHPREVFRPAIVGAAAAIVLAHNHPSGDPTPSAADISVTRDLMKAGQLLKIELLDHLVIGRKSSLSSTGFCSLRELGYLYNP